MWRAEEVASLGVAVVYKEYYGKEKVEGILFFFRFSAIQKDSRCVLWVHMENHSRKMIANNLFLAK